MSDYLLVENFVNTTAGEAFRLLPLGALVKNGKKRDITPELLAQFKLPHFKPPIKLGSHKDEAPAGGHILGLEVRPDGLYAIPEHNETGANRLKEGAYRYHSPEIIWEDGALEDPTTGAAIRGPLIVGVALLHTPHLGESTALYSIQPHTQGEDMETVNIPTSLWEKLTARLFDAPQSAPQEPKQAVTLTSEIDPDQFSAIQKERDEFAARLQTMEAEAAHKERVHHFGAKVIELNAVAQDGAGEMLASMSDVQAEWVLTRFSALTAQINESNLTSEIGKTGGEVIGDKHAQREAAIKAKMQAGGVDYLSAFEAVRTEQPDLFKI